MISGDIGAMVKRTDRFHGPFEKFIEAVYAQENDDTAEIRESIEAWKKYNPKEVEAARKKEIHAKLSAKQKVNLKALALYARAYTKIKTR